MVWLTTSVPARSNVSQPLLRGCRKWPTRRRGEREEGRIHRETVRQGDFLRAKKRAIPISPPHSVKRSRAARNLLRSRARSTFRGQVYVAKPALAGCDRTFRLGTSDSSERAERGKIRNEIGWTDGQQAALASVAVSGSRNALRRRSPAPIPFSNRWDRFGRGDAIICSRRRHHAGDRRPHHHGDAGFRLVFRASNTRAVYRPEFYLLRQNRTHRLVRYRHSRSSCSVASSGSAATGLIVRTASIDRKPLEIDAVTFDWKWLFIIPSRESRA